MSTGSRQGRTCPSIIRHANKSTQQDAPRTYVLLGVLLLRMPDASQEPMLARLDGAEAMLQLRGPA